jgi:hypothetical protein
MLSATDFHHRTAAYDQLERQHAAPARPVAATGA